MKSLRRLLSPSSDNDSPQSQESKVDLEKSEQVDMSQVHRDSESVSETDEEVMCNVLTQVEAPDYFNSMKTLQYMLAPLNKLDALVGTFNSIMTTLQHVQSEATEAKNVANKAQSENVVLSNGRLEMKRKCAHLETKHDSLYEKTVVRRTITEEKI